MTRNGNSIERSDYRSRWSVIQQVHLTAPRDAINFQTQKNVDERHLQPDLI